jgi:hypothetical protein
MSNKKETAVEWYADKLLSILGDLVNNFTKEQTLANHYALKQAKEMEKEQIIDACDYGKQYHEKFDYTSEQFYKETYTDKP